MKETPASAGVFFLRFIGDDSEAGQCERKDFDPGFLAAAVSRGSAGNCPATHPHVYNRRLRAPVDALRNPGESRQ